MVLNNAPFSSFWTDSRFLTNTEIFNYLYSYMMSNPPNFSEFFQLNLFKERQKDVYIREQVPFFLAEDLDSPTNAILWFFVQYNPGCFVIGRAAFHIKIENVHSFTEMLEILTTNDIPNCIQKYNIQIQKYTPYFFCLLYTSDAADDVIDV